MNNLNFQSLLLFLNESNSSELLLFILALFLFWTIFVFILIQFIPKKYHHYKREIFFFMVVLNFGLLFMGILLTLIMLLFGLAWATHRISRPSYETLKIEEYVVDKFPMVESKFSEGILTIDKNSNRNISTEEKIKSLRMLYESNVENNIGKIQLFLADDSDETRLYAFSLISAFEKKLNTDVKDFQNKIKVAKDKEKLEKYHLLLAHTYWQFIFHGVANEQLSQFYTKKIESTLENIANSSSSLVLLGKIHLFHKEYEEAERMFLNAVKLGLPKKAIYTYLAEIHYEQRSYNKISQYMQEEFVLDLRMKPLFQMWRA